MSLAWTELGPVNLLGERGSQCPYGGVSIHSCIVPNGLPRVKVFGNISVVSENIILSDALIVGSL